MKVRFRYVALPVVVFFVVSMSLARSAAQSEAHSEDDAPAKPAADGIDEIDEENLRVNSGDGRSARDHNVGPGQGG